MSASTRPPLARRSTVVTNHNRPRPGRRHPPRLIIAIAAAAALAVLVPVLIVVLNREPGWQPVWSEDFTGADGTAPSAKSWIVDTGTGYPGGARQWGTGEIQTYTDDPANLALDGDGNLRITPTRDESGQWRSGRLETRRADFRPAANGSLKVEARIKVPAGGPGYWAAFWMLGAPFRPAHTDWPGSGEIDVMENIGSEPSTVHGTLHCGVFDGGPCRETLGLGGARKADRAYADEFHNYAMEWDRSKPTEEIRWYVDGDLFHTVRATDVDRSTWTRATGHGFFVLFNVAIGGSWPGAPSAATRPGASMLVDHVSVSRRS
jgi:beta-glucanase (GH16 family)